MICPRCTIVELANGACICPVCGVAPDQSATKASDRSLERLARGQLTHRFDFDHILHAGSQTLVFAVRDAETDQSLALRVLRKHSGSRSIDDRLRRITRAVARLDHPRIVPVCAAGVTAELAWYAMPLVSGVALQTIVHGHGTLQLPYCLRLLQQVADAVSHAHERGIMHGGIHSGRILVDQEDRVFVTDFALVRMQQIIAAAHTQEQTVVGGATDSSATDHAPSPADDQRAIAEVICECLMGTAPQATEGTAASVRTGDANALSDLRPELPQHLRIAIAQALDASEPTRGPDLIAWLRNEGAAAAETHVSEQTVRKDRPSQPQVPRLRLQDPVAAASSPRPTPPTTAPVGNQHLLFVDGPRTEPSWAGMAIAVGIIAIAGAGLSRVPNPSQDFHASLAVPAHSAMRDIGTGQTAAAYESRVEQEDARPGQLSITSQPPGQIFIDNRFMGTTPQRDLLVRPGTHRLRIERSGFRPYDRQIIVASGKELRFEDIVLKEVPR